MPHVTVKLYPGRSEEEKSRLAEQIVKDVMTIAKCKEESISLAIEEIPPADWAEKVYRPEILSNWEKLYKKPGYNPL
jgi:4-oxalocrotonate tautomerase